MIRTQTTAYKCFPIAAGASDLERPATHGLLVLAAGNVTLTVEGPSGDHSITLTSVSAGQRIELVPKKVTAATATLVGLY